ncbi:MAG: XrtA-associated ATPase [Candidatus Omnitrophota bacterium]|nr:XrtA-associated ATPase [Candidatus Omnitrophota bacterium]
MYLEYYGLREKPFSVTADPSFLYLSKKHREAISHMQYGIQERMGFLEITGEIGAGKTTICKALLNKLDERTKTAFILNGNLSEVQLLQAITEDFGIQVKNKNKITMINELNKFLLDQLKLKNNAVLIIDEAQNLKPSLLEQVRLLSNLETEKEKLLQIILVGQPELREKLASQELKQLRQRIAIRYHISPLLKDEAKGYISHRLSVAGVNNGDIFQEDAFEEIFKFSGGIPRLINILCDKALLSGFTADKKTIDSRMVKKCAKEIEGVFDEYCE